MTLPVQPEVVQRSSGPAAPRRGRRLLDKEGLTGFVFWRLLTALGTLVFILLFNFLLFRMLPGDPAAQYRAARGIDGDDLARIRAELNAPIGEQFLSYLQDPLQLDAVSSSFGQEVWAVIGDRMWPTLVLVGTATLISITLGVAIGIKAGWARGSRFDKASTGVTLLLYATPEFWLGILLILVFASGLGWFPTAGSIDSGVEPLSLEGILSMIHHTVLPAGALAAVYIAEYSLIMRASMVDELGQDYLTTARAKGLMDRLVRRRHAVPNASLPTITLIFLNIGFIIGGAITIEYVFSYKGLGSLTIEAVESNDLALMQALFLLFSVSVLFFNLLADVVIASVDPRVRM